MRGWIKASDKYELRMLLKASNAFTALEEIVNYLRSQHKYADPPDDIETIYGKVWQICSDNAIDPWED